MRLSVTNILNKHIRLLVLLWVILTPVLLCASRKEQMAKSIDEFENKKENKEYNFDVGLLLGTGYYMGDACQTPFVQPRYVLGAQIRYKPNNRRFALQLKAQRSCLAYSYAPKTATGIAEEHTTPFVPLVFTPGNRFVQFMVAEPPVLYQIPIWSADMVCEFNFFQFGSPSYDYRVKTYTPYLFLGIGGSLSNKQAMIADAVAIPMVKRNRINVSAYVPVGIGVKWKFANRWQLQVAWQHQIYLSDNLEGYIQGIDFTESEDLLKLEHGVLNDTHDLNGFNILNNDITSTLTIGISYEFGDQRYRKYLNEKSGVSARIKRGVHVED